MSVVSGIVVFRVALETWLVLRMRQVVSEVLTGGCEVLLRRCALLCWCHGNLVDSMVARTVVVSALVRVVPAPRAALSW